MADHRLPPGDDTPPAGAPWLSSARPSARRPPATGVPTSAPPAAPAVPADEPDYVANPPAGWARGGDPRKRLLLAAAAALAVLIGGVGYLAITRDGGIGGLTGSDGGTPTPTGAAAQPALPPVVPPPAASSAAPPPAPAPSPTSAKPTTAPPPARKEPPATRPPATTRPPERRAPRQVGPDDLEGFQQLLTGFCRDNGDQAAALINGDGDSAADGTWFCVRAVAFTKVDLDEACQDRFGSRARARETKRGDARSVRCFDS